MKTTLSTARLISLKKSLDVMVKLDTMTEKEMISILERAGLSKLPEGLGWIDADGSIYSGL